MNVKYKVGKGEDISNLPYGAIILNAKTIFVDECGDRALIYLPKRLKYKFEGTITIDRGDVGSLSLAFYNDKHKYWVRSDEGYMNISLKRYEK